MADSQARAELIARGIWSPDDPRDPSTDMAAAWDVIRWFGARDDDWRRLLEDAFVRMDWQDDTIGWPDHERPAAFLWILTPGRICEAALFAGWQAAVCRWPGVRQLPGE